MKVVRLVDMLVAKMVGHSEMLWVDWKDLNLGLPMVVLLVERSDNC